MCTLTHLSYMWSNNYTLHLVKFVYRNINLKMAIAIASDLTLHKKPRANLSPSTHPLARPKLDNPFTFRGYPNWRGLPGHRCYIQPIHMRGNLQPYKNLPHPPSKQLTYIRNFTSYMGISQVKIILIYNLYIRAFPNTEQNIW